MTNPTKGQVEAHKKDQENKVIDKDENICKICFDKQSNTIIEICGHGGMCSKCCKQYLRSGKGVATCMICRSKIDKVLVVELNIDGSVKKV